MLKKFNSMVRIDRDNKFKYEGLKISLAYLIIGFFWIYFSDRAANKVASSNNVLFLIGTYKGFLYVCVTAAMLYLLIRNLLKKVYLSEKKLNESYEKLSIINDELAANVQHLSSSEEEIRVQYNSICENEKKLIKSEEKYKNLVTKMKQGLASYEAVVDEKGEIIDFIFLDSNESHEIITKSNNKDIIGKSIFHIFPSLEVKYIEKLKQVVITGEAVCYENYLPEAEKNLEVVAYRPKELQLAVIVTDINDRKQMENKLEYLSYHDQLTGLYNRRFFDEELARLDVEENLPLTLIMADVNGLKLINDSFGHAAGDKLLLKVSEVLRKGCERKDIIVRLSGDEFIIILPRTDTYEAEKTVKRIRALALKEKVESVVDTSVSFGYETKRRKEEPIFEILKKAEDYMYKEKVFESPSMRERTIDAIIVALTKNNKTDEKHFKKVSEICGNMGRALGLQEDKISELKRVALLHDIGKIAIDQSILNSPRKLTEDQWEEVKRHSEIGYRILRTVNDMSDMAEYVLAHHERWDGKGYPKGLKGNEIPIQSRIIAIADAYEAMTSERSYRNVLTKEEAIQEIERNAGAQFDEELVKIFIEKVVNK